MFCMFRSKSVMSLFDRKGIMPERCPRSEITDKESQYDDGVYEKFGDRSLVMDWGNIPCNWQDLTCLLAHLRSHPCQQYASWTE